MRFLQIYHHTSNIYYTRLSISCFFVLKVCSNEYRLLFSVTPIKRILSANSQIYLLRDNAVVFDCRTALHVDMIKRRPSLSATFNSSGNTFSIRRANTRMTGHLAFIRKCNTSFSSLLLNPLIIHSSSSCFPAAQSKHFSTISSGMVLDAKNAVLGSFSSSLLPR